MSRNSAENQRQRLLEALKQKPLSTIEARRDLDIMHPAARVQELRERGEKVITHKSTEPTENGELHTVARYVLLSSGQ